MTLEAYEEELLRAMYDHQIIASRYTSIQKIASEVKWSDIALRHGVRMKIKKVLGRLASKGYVDDRGKSGDVASLTKLGVDYVRGKV